MNTMNLAILCSLVSIIDIVLVSGTDNVADRGLNQEHYANVLDVTQPLLPVGGRDETLYDHAEHDEVVFMDKECVWDESRADHLRRELLLEQRCFYENEVLPGIVDGEDYYHFYLKWNTSEAIDCANGVTIDFEAFCISFIEYEPMLTLDDLCWETNIPNEDGVWFMDDIEGGTDDGVYSYPFFADNNLIVYVADTYTLLGHEHFDHIPSLYKKYLGNNNVADGLDHGTHVTGLIVGRKYGVIRDPTVKLRACRCCTKLSNGDTSCPASRVEGCLNEFRDDLRSEQQSNPKVRGVINMSLGGAGCGRNYFSQIAELLELGGITVVSARNGDTDACTQSPACFGDAITVGAYDSTHTRSSFSNYGKCVDAWGPGTDIRSSIGVDKQYGLMSGTSMASPIIAGMVGHLLNINGDLSLDEIKEMLIDDGQTHIVSECPRLVAPQYRHTESLKPSKGSVLTYIDIEDEMRIEMDIVVHSFPSGWASIFHCGRDVDTVRMPGIWLHAQSGNGKGFHSRFSNTGNWNYGVDTGEYIMIGNTYHWAMDIAQGSFKVTVNGDLKHRANELPSHSKLKDVACYASDPDWDAADVTISNLIVSSVQSAGECNAYSFGCEDLLETSWQKVLDLQPTTVDVGQSAFNQMFWNSEYPILKRVCNGCAYDHKEIFYKRLTKLHSFDLYSYTYDWKKTDNVLGVDFNLYSTFDDAVNDREPWEFCNYDDQNIGMFRDCGRKASIGWQWSSKTRGGQAVSFYIYATELGFEASFTADSLSSDGSAWRNEGILGSSIDMTSLTGSVRSEKTNVADGIVAALCFDSSVTDITFVNFDTDFRVRPDLTMEVWWRPDQYVNNRNWILGHDDGGYDRAILSNDDRFGGLAMGLGTSYSSTLGTPSLGEWVHIVATYSANGVATLYKNGGDLAGGSQQSRTVTSDSGSHHERVGLNGLEQHSNHQVVGCFAQVQLTNRVASPQEVQAMFDEFDAVINSGASWQKVLDLQPTSVDLGQHAFNRLFWNSKYSILKRVCNGCDDEHKEIFYKRMTKLHSFDLYSYTYDWKKTDNVLGVDFNLYSTFDNAVNDHEPWKYCNYDDQNIGMFRDCGREALSGHQWSSKTKGGQTVSFYIFTDEALSDYMSEAQPHSVDVLSPDGPLEVSMPNDWSVWYQMHRDQLVFLLGAMLVVLCGVNVCVVFSKRQQRRYVMVKSIDSDMECGVDVENVSINE